MDIDKFDQAAKEFRMYVDALVMRANDDIRQARESLTAIEQRDPSNENIAALCLSRLAETIEELMRCNDKLNASIGLPAQYRVFFDLQNLSPHGQQAIRKAIAEYSDTDADS